ncbi:MAG: hypothetical protein LBQ16_00750 [Gracilibacteraceae bacterium]|jgi:hypothetical protein|nr:hypothetical protein [Gracilibacteraceae bacterium]
MRETDGRLLESLEKIHRCLETEMEKLKDIKAAPADSLREMALETRGLARLLEEVSVSGRLVIEYALELRKRNGQIAVETEAVRQDFCAVRQVRVEEFGILRLTIADLCLTWRDGGYNYLFYPDKVEMRSRDEKSVIKLFFSQPFDQRFLCGQSEVLTCPRVLYLHPEIDGALRDCAGEPE